MPRDANQEGSKSQAQRTKSETLKPDREKKIGHRRVGEGGEVTYKKVILLNINLFQDHSTHIQCDLDSYHHDYGFNSTGYRACCWRSSFKTGKRLAHAGLHDY